MIDTKALGPWTIHIDADVIEADGGTRTAAITAAFVAVADALKVRFGSDAGGILTDSIAAVSAGIVKGEPVVDLDYIEDSRAEVDMNVVRLGSGGLVEVQGTGVRTAHSHASNCRRSSTWPKPVSTNWEDSSAKPWGMPGRFRWSES